MKIYYLTIGDVWQNKKKIEDKATLMQYLPLVPKTKNVKDKLVFFVHFGDVSPDNTPDEIIK